MKDLDTANAACVKLERLTAKARADLRELADAVDRLNLKHRALLDRHAARLADMDGAVTFLADALRGLGAERTGLQLAGAVVRLGQGDFEHEPKWSK